jgi:class 3 adenylate cyclase
MLTLFRSIRTKIFGVVCILLVIMAASAIWSASLTERVHLQMLTLNQALFPMALRVAEMRTSIVSEALPLALPEPQCRADMAKKIAASTALIDEADALRALGGRMARLERNRVEMARLEPMFAELRVQHGRMAVLMPDACAALAAPAMAQAGDVLRLADAITTEIEMFVEAGAVRVGENQRLAARATLVMIGVAGVVGLLLAALVTRGLTRPILRLQSGARAVRGGDLDTEVPVTSRDEIGDVTEAFNTMIAGLREKDRIKETFGQYVDPRVVSDLVRSGSERATAGEKQVATLFFSDIAGFTAISERLTPVTLVALINAYFTAMSGPLRQHSGIIDKYIGDAIMAFWVPPFVDRADQARLACAAALEQLECLEAFQAEVPDLVGIRRDVPIIDARIALTSGEVVVGSIGSQQARSFTVMGDTVNRGSRLEAINKLYGTRVLIDGMTRDMAGDAICVREIDLVVVAGGSVPVRIYELGAMAGALDAARARTFAAYEQALALYRAGDWHHAAAALEPLTHDGPARTLLARMADAGGHAPAGWDGVWHLSHK